MDSLALFNQFCGPSPSSSHVTKRQGERRFVSMFPTIMGGSGIAANWSSDRYRQVNQFRDNVYIPINVAATEAAQLPPTVAHVVPADEKDEAVQKALRRGGVDLADRTRRKYLHRGQKRKALLHVQGDDEVRPVEADHRLARIFKRPNPLDCYWTWAYKISMYLDLSGVCYLWVVPNRLGEPCALWPLPPHWVREIPGDGRSGRLIDAYEVRPVMGYMATEFGGGWFPGMSGGQQAVFKRHEVIAIKYPSPVHYTDGYSPLSAIGPWIDVASNIDSARLYAFKNSAFPGVVLEVDPQIEDPGPEEIERWKAAIENQWQGVRNNKRPVVLAPGLKLVPFTPATSVEMEYMQSHDQMRNNIFAAYGMSQSVAGITENTTYANADAGRLNFYRGRMGPKMSLIGQVLTFWAQEAFDDEQLNIFWNKPTPEDPELELKRQDQDLRTGCTHVNEVREERGKEPYEYGGDNPTLALGLHEVPWATGEEDPAMQAAEQQQAGAAGGAGGAAPAMGQPQDDQQGQVPDDYDLQKLLGGAGAGGDGADAMPPTRRLTGPSSNGKAGSHARR